MPFKAPPSAASAAALNAANTPKPAEDVLGTAGSPDALKRLTAAMSELRAVAVQPLLLKAVDAINAENLKDAAANIVAALQRDEDNGFGWYLFAILRERMGDFAASVVAYERALQLIPQHAEVANDLGRLAFRMNMKPQAEKLFRLFLAAHPEHPEAINNLACAVRDQARYEEATEILRPAILRDPTSAQLWNTMGSILAEQGDFENADIFFKEALRLDAGFVKARYNSGNARLALGDSEAALEACDGALAGVTSEEERQMMRLARSTILMSLGRIGEGWDEYEARLHPQFADATAYLFEQPRWQPGDDVAGKTLLVVGEQGLGDEVLFGNLVPDVLAQVGPRGRLILAIEPRLIPLFRRAFPSATIVEHATHILNGTRLIRSIPWLSSGEAPAIDLWTPIGSLLREHRRTVESFPDRPRFLAADPDRVAHWREVLAREAPAGPKVGLLWKSAVKAGARHRYFSPFDQWRPILATPGASFINLQYGDCSGEIAEAREQLGVEIWQPPGIDLRENLDDVAALSCAMDLVLGFSNATLNIAAACGAPTWLISTPGAWPRLGTDRYPWYPQVRTFTPQRFGEWAPLMADVASEFGAFVAASQSQPDRS